MTLNYLLGCVQRTNRSPFVEISFKTQKHTSHRGRRLVDLRENGDMDKIIDIFACRELS